MLTDLLQALHPLRSVRCGTMLDIGCGYGGLARLVSQHVGASEVHGIDLDPDVLTESQEKGVITHLLDVSQKPLPFPDCYFDLVMCLGMLDYLACFDRVIREIYRVTQPGGHTLISLPNLASWHNRVFLLMGYQPRDVEVSREVLPGVHPWYKSDSKPTGHIHTVTTKAFSELAQFHGFQTVRVIGSVPGGRAKNRAIDLIDRVLSKRVSLARRFFYIGRKPNKSP